MNTELRAAAAKIRITPEEEIGLAGFDPIENVAYPPKDVLDDLYARVLLLDDGRQQYLQISVDCCMVNEDPVRVCDPGGSVGRYRTFAEVFAPGTRQRWAEDAGIDEANIVVYATHTHSAPEHFSEKYVRRISEKIRHLPQQLVPVRISVSSGDSRISAFRRPTLFPNPDVPIDQTLYVVLLETTEGIPFAGIVNYAVHPTILHPSQGVQLANRVSSECVGFAMNELEKQFGNEFVSLFAQGFSGDVAPILPGMGALEDSYPNVQKAGHQLFLDIMATQAKGTPVIAEPIHIRHSSINIPTRDGFYVPFLEVTIVCMSVGDIAFLYVPGEVFNGYVTKIRDASPYRYTILTSLANGYNGYFPTAEAFRDGLGGYEMTTTPYDDRIDNLLTSASVKLLNETFQAGKG